MRIGLVIEEFNAAGGGAERWTAQFHTHLLQAGHEVHVLAFRAVPPHDILHLHLMPDPGTLLGRAEAVAAMAARLPPMVLHDNGTSWSGHVFHPHTGSRLLSMNRMLAAERPALRLRTALSPRMALLRRRMARIEHLAATRARRVIALSARLRGMLAERHGVGPARLVTIPNGVDTARFAPARLTPLRDAARRRLGAGDRLLLLTVAHNLRLKGVDTALRALAALHAAGLPARLVVAGGVPDAGWTALVARLGLAGDVAFLGDVAAVEELYAAADILLHPTRWDACSLATIEAMAAGLPVLTTVENGAADLITDGVDGIVMPDPDDHRALAAHVLALRDPARRAAMGAAAARRGAEAEIAANCRAVEAVLAAAAAELRLQ
jgi:UDP-glucose:(heptosyl)LPS alpha-1,3-glucosyltransferase